MTFILRGEVIRFDGNPFTGGQMVLDGDGGVLVREGKITDVGHISEIVTRHRDLRVVETNGLIAPGFVDAHVHYPQIGVIASWGADLIDWLNTYTFPEESRFADRGHADAAASAYFDEQMRHGITTATSFCTIHPASVDAYFAEAARRGLRAIGGKVMMDRNAPDGLRDTAQSAYDDSLALIERWHGEGRLSYAITPRFAPTSTPAQLEAAGALARAHPTCLIQTHLSEQPREIDWVASLFPDALDYLGVYEQSGLVRQGAVFGHAIHLTPREREVLAETGAAIAHCPTSNQFLGSGECDVRGLIEQGVSVGLATDTGGGTSYSMFDTMKSAYEVAARRGTILRPEELWWLATAGAAEALGLGDVIGNIAPGMDADLVVLDAKATPLLAQRSARSNSIAETLFTLIVLGDDRSVRATWSAGELVGGREFSAQS